MGDCVRGGMDTNFKCENVDLIGFEEVLCCMRVEIRLF